MTSQSTAGPRIVIVGQLTIDLHAHDSTKPQRPGGAVSYAARAAAALGERASILTAGGVDADLDALANHDIELVPTDNTLTFELDDNDGRRHLRLLRGNDRRLHADDLPPTWRNPRLLILAPLLPHDIDVGSFHNIRYSEGRALLAQGLQRRIDSSSSIHTLSRPSSALLQHCSAEDSVFLSHEDTDGWLTADFYRLASAAARLIVTRGAAGSDVHRPSQPPLHIEPYRATPVDTTGAGDVFATAFMIALYSSHLRELRDQRDAAAARIASACAASSVEQYGPAALPSNKETLRQMSDGLSNATLDNPT